MHRVGERMKLKALTIIIIAMILLSGCGRTVEKVNKEPEDQVLQLINGDDYGGYWAYIMRDKETGCEYIVGVSAGYITPRMNADGTQKCK